MIKIFFEKMLLIDIFFEWIVVDLVGFILFVIEKGNIYILIVVDYSIRYFEVIFLKSIEIERVVEVLVYIFSMMGILKEIFFDMGI